MMPTPLSAPGIISTLSLVCTLAMAQDHLARPADFGIDYKHPSNYLSQGTQTTIAPEHLSNIPGPEIRGDSIAEIRKLFVWKETLRNVPAGGKFVGVRTMNDIMASGELTGCHDHGILMASLLRHRGYPAIMVDATGVAWSLTPRATRKGYVGHVFIEVYAADKWVLIDSTTGRMATAYDPRDPLLPLANPGDAKGYYAMFKGVDPAGYGIRSIRELNDAQDKFVDEVRRRFR